MIALLFIPALIFIFLLAVVDEDMQSNILGYGTVFMIAAAVLIGAISPG